jgi:predicted S18 family serine protease
MKSMHDMKSKLLAGFLILSIILNIYLFTVQPAREDLMTLKDKINFLEKSNAELSKQLYLDNLSNQNYASQLDLYRHRISELESKLGSTASGEQGTAELQAPAVMQKVEYISDYPFVRQQVVQVGSMMNISVEIKPGKGRVLVQTRPLMGVVFQDAANTAVYVAQNNTKKDLSGSDIIFSIEADQEIPSVDGPSAGALMTVLAISALENQGPKKDITLTGTIDRFGHIGEIGGVIEKALAAKDSGKTLILIPRENSRLIQYTERTRNFYGMTIIETVPEVIDAKEYIEAKSGIKVEYIDTIDDVLKFAI